MRTSFLVLARDLVRNFLVLAGESVAHDGGDDGELAACVEARSLC